MERMKTCIRSIVVFALAVAGGCAVSGGCGGMSVGSGPGARSEVTPDSAAAAAAQLVAERDFGGAMLIYRGILEVDPQHVPSLRGMLDLSSQTGDATTGAHYYEILSQGDALIASDVLTMAALYERSGNSSTALEVLEAGADRFPENTEILSALGLALVKAGNTVEARRRLEAAAPAGGDAGRRAHRALADLLFEAGDYEAALPVLLEYETRYPGDFSVNMRAGWIYLESGDYDAAIDHYRLAVDAKPSSVDARVSLASAYEKSGRVDSAIRTYDKAIKQRGMVREAEPLILAEANLLNRKGRYDRTLELLEEAGEAFPLTPALNCALGMALAGDGRYDEAVEAFESAIHDRQYGDFARDQIKRVEGLKRQSR